MLKSLQGQPESKKKAIILVTLVVVGSILLLFWLQRAINFRPRSFFQGYNMSELKNNIPDNLNEVLNKGPEKENQNLTQEDLSQDNLE